MMCRLPDYILREFREKIDKVMDLCGSAHFDLVRKMSRKKNSCESSARHISSHIFSKNKEKPGYCLLLL